MGKEFDVEVRITAIVTIVCFFSVFEGAHNPVQVFPSRFPFGMKWMDAHDFWDVRRTSVPESDARSNPALKRK